MFKRKEFCLSVTGVFKDAEYQTIDEGAREIRFKPWLDEFYSQK